MKRILIPILSLLALYAIYIDFSVGTIPLKQPSIESVEVIETVEDTETTYFEKVVQHGDTVISIIEESLNGPIPVSINVVVADFESLNEGVQPEEIQFGKAYRFPDYRNLTEQ